eukprot:6179910-Pleurochrysis_carterae.AAC.3
MAGKLHSKIITCKHSATHNYRGARRDYTAQGGRRVRVNEKSPPDVGLYGMNKGGMQTSDGQPLKMSGNPRVGYGRATIPRAMLGATSRDQSCAE